MIDLGIGNLRIKKAGRSGIYALFNGEDLVTPLTNLEEHLAAMIEELEQRLAETEAKIPKWIPVSERLPEVHKEVLCIDGSNDQSTCYLSDNGNFYGLVFGQHAYDCGASILTGHVTYWMPRPDKPVE